MMTGGNIAAEFHAAAIDRLEAPFLLDGKRTWTYGKYKWSAFGEAETTDLVVRFNQDGTVSSYVYNTTE